MLPQTSEGEILLVLDCNSKQLMFSHCTVTVTEAQVLTNMAAVWSPLFSQFLEGLVMAQSKLSEVNEIYRTVMRSKLSCLVRSE